MFPLTNPNAEPDSWPSKILSATTHQLTAWEDHLGLTRWTSPQKNSPRWFREHLLIDVCGAVPRPLAEVIEPWQADDYAALDDAWQRLAGEATQPRVRRAYIERPRGHSKTCDLAVMASWVLWSSPRQLYGVAASGDREQARLLRDAIDRLARLNPWLQLDVQRETIKNPVTGSRLDILSSDAGTSYGLTPDFLIVDELTHWRDEAGLAFWTSLISAAAKRPDSLVVVIANAGFTQGEGWQWQVRETCRTDPHWHFSRLDGPSARRPRRTTPPSPSARIFASVA